MASTTSERPTRLTNQLHNVENWNQLLEGEVDAIHLKAFASPVECDQLLAFVQNHPEARGYETAAGIIRIGSSFSDIRKSGHLGEYSKADILEQSLAVSPVIPRLIGWIAASWPYGLETYCPSGLLLHRSIARRIVEGGAEPHDDNIAKDMPDDRVASTVRAQLGVNLYIEAPKEGGELQGWHRRLSSTEYDAIRNEDRTLAYAVRRDAIGPYDWSIRPDCGDVIIFNNSELHAIGVSKGARTTWGFFLGYRCKHKPLLIWS